jgi:hypothetical protein
LFISFLINLENYQIIEIVLYVAGMLSASGDLQTLAFGPLKLGLSTSVLLKLSVFKDTTDNIYQTSSSTVKS